MERMPIAAAPVALLLTLTILAPLRGQPAPACYTVSDVATPEGVAPEVSAITFTTDGRLAACFRLGSVWLHTPRDGTWRRFASGLFWPLGILAGEPGEFFIAQVPELTRVADTDGDGEADLYETLSDDWGLSGNYHEFLAGPVRDADGNFFLSLGCASSGGPLRPPLRGEPTPFPRRNPKYGHHSPVPWRGWIVRISPEGELEPWASGFRQANGLTIDLEGRLLATDNQGDWIGTSPLHHVTRGTFHGHPASLVWDPAIERNPEDIPVEELAVRRKPAAVLFPQDDLAGSVSQPLCDTTGGRFGPFSGQIFIADWTHARIHRVFLEEIEGTVQGACFPFLDAQGLRRGSNRLAFAPNGSLWVAQVSRVWGGAGEGLQKVSWNGETPFDVLAVRARPDGFEIEWTLPAERAAAGATRSYSAQHYSYHYHAQYGSPKVDPTPVVIDAVEVSANGRHVRLRLGELIEGKVYELRCPKVRAEDGTPVASRFAAYTVNRRPAEAEGR